MLVQYRALPEVPAAVDAAVGLLVRVDPEVLGQVGLLPEPLPALGTRVRSGLDVYAAVLQQGRFLLEFLLADGAPDVQGHTCNRLRLLEFLGVNVGNLVIFEKLRVV